MDPLSHSDMVSADVLVSGRVQGVWYRGFAEETALQLGLCGWVRNLPNGDVQLEIEGPRHRVEDMLGRLRTGPPRAVVSNLTVTWKAPGGKHSGFKIVH
jgi:acylphosphatase